MCKDNYAANVSQITPRGRSPCRIYDGLAAPWPPVGALTGSDLRHNNNYALGALVTRFGVPAGRDRKRSKIDALTEDGALNPAPEKVRDPKFQEGGFFDPSDIVQVKYEMLRRASVEKASVTEVSEEYGVSRPTYYQATAGFRRKRALPDLVPRKRGPRGPHKIQGEVSAFLRAAEFLANRYAPRELAKSLQKEFGLDAHPRTIERAIQCKTLQKDDWDHGQSACASRPSSSPATRGCAVGQRLMQPLPPDARSGLVVFLHRRHVGMARACCRSNPPGWIPMPSRSLGMPAQLIERRAIVCLLAGMQMAIPTTGGRHECSAQSSTSPSSSGTPTSTPSAVIDAARSSRMSLARGGSTRWGRANALGWRMARRATIVVVDDDQGESGASASSPAKDSSATGERRRSADAPASVSWKRSPPCPVLHRLASPASRSTPRPARSSSTRTASDPPATGR